jgi:general secretion pathway protein A
LSEMTHRRRTRSNVLMDGRTAMGLFLLLCLLVIGLLYRQQLSELMSGPFKKDKATGISSAMRPGDPQEPGAASASNTVPNPIAAAAPAQTASAAAETPPSAGAGASLSVNLTHMETRASRLKALKEALEAWGTPLETKAYLEAVDDDPTYFNLSAKASGFFVQRIEGDLDFLRKLDMPAILEFRTAKPAPAYLTLTAIEGEKFLLNGGSLDDLTVRADAKEINQHWTGVAYVPWKNFLSLSGNIPGNAPADSVLALKMLLRDLGHADIPLSKDYDPATQKIVELLQLKYGLPVDGVVGSLTKIILYREGKTFDIPHVAGN